MDFIRSRHVIAAFVVSLLLSASGAYAQAAGDTVINHVGPANLHGAGTLLEAARGNEIVLWRGQRTAREPMTAPSGNIRQALAALDYGAGVVSNWKSAPAFQASSGRRQRSTGSKVLGGVIGAVGGFFGGGFLGAAIEGDRCDCDDPGLAGFLIGAPTGAAVGAILGVKFL